MTTTTTTIEKLFAHIFDRKCRVINQARQQADSYAQHLASKLLIDGISPPPWLWNPNSNSRSSSDPQEFKHEDLLSEPLQPHPRPTVPNSGNVCSLYNHPVILEGNEEVEARVFGETNVSNEGFDLEQWPAFVSGVNGSEIGSASNAPERDVTATSRQEQIVVRTSAIITESANEEALKGSSSETLVLKSGDNADESAPLPEFNYNNVGCASAFAPEQDQSIISPNQGQNEMRISSNAAARDQSLLRIQRSKSRQKALELRKTVEKEVKTHQTNMNSSGVCFSGDKIFSNTSNQLQPHQEGKPLALTKTSETTSRMYAEAQAVGDCLSNAKYAKPYSGRITRSKTSCNLFTNDSNSKLDNALEIAEVDGRTIRSQNNCVEGISKHVHSSNASIQRVTRSKFQPSGKFSLNYLKGHEVSDKQNASRSEFILCCPDGKSIEQIAKTDCLVETEVILDGSVVCQAASSESKLDGAGPSVELEGFDLRPSSNCGIIMEPKILDFNEVGKINLNEVITSMVGKEILDKSLKRCESAKSPALLGKFTCSNWCSKSIGKQSVGKEVLNQITESCKDSYETCSRKCVVDDEQVTKSRMSKNVEDCSDVDGRIQNSPIHQWEQTRSSYACEDTDMLMYKKKEEPCSIPNQLVQKCEIGCNQMVRGDASLISSFIYDSSKYQVSSLRLPEPNDTSASTPEATQCHVEESQNVMNLEIAVDGGMASRDNVLLQQESSVRDDGFLACNAEESIRFDGKNFISDEIRDLHFLESSMQGRILRSTAENTWPQFKRRKVQSQETSSISAAVSFKVKENHDIGRNSDNKNLNSIRANFGSALQFESSPSQEENAAESDVSKSHEVKLRPKILTQEIESLPGMPIEQDDLGFGGKGLCKRFPVHIEDGECMSFGSSSLSNGDAKDSEISFGLNGRTANATSTVMDEITQGTGKDNEDFVHFDNDLPLQNEDELTHDGRTLLETRPYVDDLVFGEKSLCKRFPVHIEDGECMSFATSSLSNGDAKDSEISFGLNSRTANASSTVMDEITQGTGKDYEDLVHFENDLPWQNKDELTRDGTLLETKPYVVEDGFCPFSVAFLQDKHLGTSALDQTTPEIEGFIVGEEESGQKDAFDCLEIPTTSVERASLLEELCRSAVTNTTIYQFSAPHRLHRTPDVYESVSKRILEHLDPKITLNSNGDSFQQLEASNSSVELKNASQKFYPDEPISDTCVGQILKIPPTSPVSKLWGQISSQSFSSEKKLRSNPELTCFPIEEDPSISEEKEDGDEVANLTLEYICSASMGCGDKRNPLADITQANVNPPSSVSAEKKSRDRSSLNTVDTEINFTRTQDGIKREPCKHPSKKRFGTHETKKKLTLSTSRGITKESLNNGFSKPNFSRKTSLRKGGQTVSGRESKHNNIISNISSFVPLVQRKQAVALITGKRDVKVKALEAAEAAKRLEERKENERKLKKEALKLERARQEQENMRQAELKRNKKEEQLKKKEAGVAARKRLREEEEKKEKERKRRQFEGKRRQQKEQEEKFRAQRLEKELRVGIKDAKLNSGMVIADALQKPHKVKLDVDIGDGNNVKKPDTELVVTKNLENDVRQAILNGFEACGHSRVSSVVSNTCQGKSYEISPYQSSDDEDDEEDEVSPRKFVPSWASKKSLALIVSSQQDVDPDILFASKSFCSVDEVSGLGVYKK